MNPVQIINASNNATTAATKQAIYQPPWEKDSPLSLRERLHQTASPLRQLNTRMRDRPSAALMAGLALQATRSAKGI